MKAAVLVEPSLLEIQELPVPVILADDDVIIEVKATGLCGSDLQVFRGHRAVKLPHVLGHEVSGIVRQVGPGVKNLRAGDRITVEPNFRCGTCEICRKGRYNLCPSKMTMGLTMPGSLAEYVKVPEAYAWKIPDTMSHVEAAVVEPATVAVHAVNKAGTTVGDRVLILGAGPIGLLAMQCARLAGAEVTVSDIASNRLALAAELGADHCSNGADLKERTYDEVIDAAGMPSTFLASLSLVRQGGTVVLVGLGNQPVTFDPVTIVRQEVSIKGIIACVDEFPKTIDLIARGKLLIKPLVNCELRLAEVETGLRLMEDRVAVKPVVLF
ncbi:MAG: zinc-dependent alcohol dehydrogenase [Ignavibacteriales bacterium]